MAKKILVVDDEADLREILMFNLESEGYEVVTADSGEAALEVIDESFDLILLDVMMGGISGLRVAEKLRRERGINTPIVFLTAKVTENDMLTGFSVGADDYITKPFSLKEIIARCRAVIKRTERMEVESTVKESDTVAIDELEIILSNMEVRVAGQEIQLTKKEYEILVLLVSSLGRTFSREEILTKVWHDDAFVLDRTVDVHITRLRKKLGELGARIVNRSGYGYTFK